MTQISDNVTAKGRVHLQVIGEDGQLKDERIIDNLVVTIGKQFIASRMASAAKAVMSHMAIGTGATAPVVGNSTLQTEVARVALTTAGGNAAGAVVTYDGNFPPGTGVGDIVEAGLFNAGGAGAGEMLARVTFGVVTKGVNDRVIIVWTVTIL